VVAYIVVAARVCVVVGPITLVGVMQNVPKMMTVAVTWIRTVLHTLVVKILKILHFKTLPLPDHLSYVKQVPVVAGVEVVQTRIVGVMNTVLSITILIVVVMWILFVHLRMYNHMSAIILLLVVTVAAVVEGVMEALTRTAGAMICVSNQEIVAVTRRKCAL